MADDYIVMTGCTVHNTPSAEEVARLEAEIARLTAELAHIHKDRTAWANVELSEENDRLIADNEKLRAEIERLTAQVDGWKRTALAMRDAAICWEKDGKNRYEEIERMYFDAAMFSRWQVVYHDTAHEQ